MGGMGGGAMTGAGAPAAPLPLMPMGGIGGIGAMGGGMSGMGGGMNGGMDAASAAQLSSFTGAAQLISDTLASQGALTSALPAPPTTEDHLGSMMLPPERPVNVNDGMMGPPPERGTKRAKADVASSGGALARVADSMLTTACNGSNDSGDSGSRDGTSDSGSWTTGTYLIAKFTGFCAKLARKRRPAERRPKQLVAPPSHASPLAPLGAEKKPPPPMADNLKLAILEKLDVLLEHGDHSQLARIEKSLADLHLERSLMDTGPTAPPGLQ